MTGMEKLRGSKQCRTIRYSRSLAEAGAVALVGSMGDSQDNAMSEAFNSLHKYELIGNCEAWYGELAHINLPSAGRYCTRCPSGHRIPGTS